MSSKPNNIKSLNSIETNNIPLIIGKVYNRQVKFVIDTGATTSIISRNILPNNHVIYPSKNVCVRTANGSQLNSIGQTILKVRFANQMFSIECTVVNNLSTYSLLGYDFLKKYSASIYTQESKLSLLKNNKKIFVKFLDYNFLSKGTEHLINFVPVTVNEIAAKSEILTQVAPNGWCGVSALEVVLNNKGINIDSYEIKKLLGIHLIKKPIYLESEDLASVTDHFDLGLIVVLEDNINNLNSVLFFSKSHKSFVTVLFSNCHWTPLVYCPDKMPFRQIHNVIQINEFDSLAVRKNILQERISKHDFTNSTNTEWEDKNITYNDKRDAAKNVYNDSHANTTQFSRNNTSLSPNVTTVENVPDWDINPALPVDQQNKLRALLMKYDSIFSKHKYDLGSCKIAPIELQLSSSKIINLPNFKLSRVERNEIEKQTEELLKAGIVEESLSPYSNPVFLVAKNQGQGGKDQEKSKEYRMVIDFRKLNEIIYRESFPLPIIQNLYDCLAGNQYFSSLDATSGFHQIELSENSKALTAYSTENYHVHFTRLPFGLSNAPQFYQAAMCKVMAGLNYRHNICYLDDCVAFGKSFESHLHSLELTFQRFLKYNLKLKPSKCRFGYQELKVLGNIIDTKGIRPTQQGIETIQKFPQPKTIKQLRSFLGLANYFRRYIPKFSNIAKPLTDLTRGKFNSKSSPIKWEDEHERAFLELKSKLTSQPVLAHYDENAETIIVTDGSKLGLGAILQQRNQNNEIHPVAFSSKKLTKAEGRYSAMDLECLAIFHALTVFRPYVHGKYFEIWTDHKNLTSLLNIKTDSRVVNKLKVKLTGFNYSIKYKEGIFNKAADCLSRIVDEPPKPSEFTELSKINTHVLSQDLNINLVQQINIQLEQASDNYLQNILTALKNPMESNSVWLNKSKNYVLKENDVLYYKTTFNNAPKLVLALPNKFKKIVIYENHDSVLGGHQGLTKTYLKIRQRYYWPKMRKEIKSYVLSCPDCQKRKPFKQPKPPKVGMYPLEKGEIMQEIYLDYIGPLNNSKSNKYILVATDRISKFCVAKPYANANARSTVKFLLDIILRFGCMRIIRSDNGTHFTSKTVKQLLDSLNVDQKFGIPYHPTSQGQVERQNQTLIDMISNYVKDNEKLWSDYLPYMVFAYNSSIHKVTGYSPFYLVHGFEPKSVFELALVPPEDQDILSEISKIKKIRKLLPELLKQASEQVKQKKPLPNTRQYKVGDQVLVKNETSSTKFRDRYNGPYEIIKDYPPFSYIVRMPKNNRLVDLPVHIDQIKPFHNRSNE